MMPPLPTRIGHATRHHARCLPRSQLRQPLSLRSRPYRLRVLTITPPLRRGSQTNRRDSNPVLSIRKPAPSARATLARLAKIDFEERTEKLVSADEVRVASFNRFRQFRDGMLNIPDRLAAVLAAESNPRQVHELLAAEIRKALVEFSDANR